MNWRRVEHAYLIVLIIGYSVSSLHISLVLSIHMEWWFSEDVSANMNALEILHAKFNTQLLLIESGGDNLAANYSRELGTWYKK